MFERVVVGVDGRDGGRDAVELARQLMSPAGQVILANVYSDAGTAGLGGRLAVATQRDHAHTLLNRCRQDSLPEAETVACFDGSPGHGCMRSLPASTPICWPSGHRVAAWSVAS
jgi:hypothetical protein